MSCKYNKKNVKEITKTNNTGKKQYVSLCLELEIVNLPAPCWEEPFDGVKGGRLWVKVPGCKTWLLMTDGKINGKIHCLRQHRNASGPFSLLLWWYFVIHLKMWDADSFVRSHCWHHDRGPHFSVIATLILRLSIHKSSVTSNVSYFSSGTFHYCWIHVNLPFHRD